MAVTATDPPRTSGRRRARRRRAGRAVAVSIVVVSLIAGGVVFVRNLMRPGPPAAECRVASADGPYTFELEQAANATTIAGVGKRLGMPDHAVTVALAAAFQESNLYNLDYGDRDSLGLFQQRPSQGWGAPAQLTNPSYAAAAFYRELAKVPGWRTMDITDAAQRVQRSGAPSAYAKWEPPARALAVALTGESAAAFTCAYPKPHATPGTDYAPALRNELGVASFAEPLPAATGWAAAAWLVGHARQYGIRTVSLRGQRWSASNGKWKPDGSADARVRVEQN